MAWYTFQIKTLYNSNPQYVKMRDALINLDLGLKAEDFFFPGNLERENPYVNYVFVRTDRDFRDIWPVICKEKYISGYDGWFPVSDQEMEGVRQSISSKRAPVDLLPHDVVTITYGPYAKMFGVVVSKSEGKYEIGFNFFTGPQFRMVDADILERKKSLFEIWKFPVKDGEEQEDGEK